MWKYLVMSIKRKITYFFKSKIWIGLKSNDLYLLQKDYLKTSGRQNMKSYCSWKRLHGDKNRELSGFVRGIRIPNFFHQVANSNRRINSIDRLPIDRSLTTDQTAIGEGLVNFYSNFFSDEALRCPLLDDLPFSSITEEDGLALDRQFTKEEVWEVINEMAGDKAPRSDGYTMAFS